MRGQAARTQRDEALAQRDDARAAAQTALVEVERLTAEIARQRADYETIALFIDGASVVQRPRPGSERVGDVIQLELVGATSPFHFLEWRPTKCSDSDILELTDRQSPFFRFRAMRPTSCEIILQGYNGRERGPFPVHIER